MIYGNLKIGDVLNPISDLTKGKTKELFNKVSKNGYTILTKNSNPKFALLSIDAFEELATAKEELEKLKLELKIDKSVEELTHLRMETFDKDESVDLSEVMDKYNITEEDLENVSDEDIEFEYFINILTVNFMIK